MKSEVDASREWPLSLKPHSLVGGLSQRIRVTLVMLKIHLWRLFLKVPLRSVKLFPYDIFTENRCKDLLKVTQVCVLYKAQKSISK